MKSHFGLKPKLTRIGYSKGGGAIMGAGVNYDCTVKPIIDNEAGCIASIYSINDCDESVMSNK